MADIAGEALSPKSLARLQEDRRPTTLPLVRGEPRLGACVGHVGNFIAVGLNYADHAAESNMPIPKEPILFNKAPSCIVGPNDDVVIPKGSVKTDWEVELAIVIGSPRFLCQRGRRASAMSRAIASATTSPSAPTSSRARANG